MSDSPSEAEQRWREIVERQRASGSTVAAFCRDNRVATSSFFAWKRKLLGGAPAAFVEAAVVGTPPASPASRASIEVLLRNGRRVRVGRRGFDRGLLAEVVAALEGMA
jgi:transposase-like protein